MRLSSGREQVIETVWTLRNGACRIMHEFGNTDAELVLIQMVDEHDLAEIEDEVKAIKDSTGVDFKLVTLEVSSWNHDLSPWRAPAVFGKEDFGDGAEATLEEVKRICSDPGKTYIIGGYSLAGLFALWAAYRTDIFKGVAAASPSMWFPGFVDYMKDNEIKTDKVYLSLGDKEAKARNPVMATVADKITEAHELLQARGAECTLEWNPGNHFRDAGIRTAKAFSWLIKNFFCRN